MDLIHTNALRIITSLKEVVDFLSSAVDIEKLDEQIKKFEKVKLSPDDKLKSYEVCFKLVNDLHHFLQRLGDIKLDSDKHSETFRMSYLDLVNRAKAKYTAFTKDVDIAKVAITTELSNELFEQISKSDKKLENIKDLRAKYQSAPELIGIYANIMQKSIDTFFTQDKSLVFQLLAFISEDKTKALQGNYQSSITKGVKTNPPQSRFGLLPVTSSMPLKDLLPIIMVEEKNVVASSSFTQLAKKYNIGFIVVNSIVYTPVEYNVRSLINADDAKKYIQPNEYGITTKTVERFKTLSTLGNTNKWDFTIDIHNKDSDKFYILETLDGKLYRCLAPWLQSSKYSVAKFRVQKLLDYNADKPSRALEYQSAAIQIATKNMFLGKSLAIEDFESQISNVESGQMLTYVVDAVLNVANDLLNKTKIKDTNDVNDLLHDPIINSTFISSIEKAFALDPKRFDGGKFPTAEIMASFITAVQNASRRFAREIHNGYSRDPLKPSEFTSDLTTNKELAAKKIEHVIRSSIELIIKLDDNLFTSNYYKYLILNYAL